MQYSALAEKDQAEAIQFAMEVLVKRNSNILSLALVQKTGQIMAQVGDHMQVWVQPPGEQSTLQFLQVPIFSGNQQWGALQIALNEQGSKGPAVYKHSDWSTERSTGCSK